MGVLGRISRRTVAAALFHEQLPRGLAVGLVASVPLVLSTELFAGGEWPLAHRGLGLSITRSIVEGAGGMIHAANRDPVGACFQIELPVQIA